MPPVPRVLTALGPAYIKFGQILSTRPDVVGSELAQQLRVLQDKLPPFSVEIAKKTVEAELERPIGDMLSLVNRLPQHHWRKRIKRGWKRLENGLLSKFCARGLSVFIRDVDAFYGG